MRRREGLSCVGFAGMDGIVNEVCEAQRRENTAVEAFAIAGLEQAPAHADGTYRTLMPATPPVPGTQYAFEVDLDACSGCGSCVAACHQKNDLHPGELWRRVGYLVGGTPSEPALLQAVPSACHHCLEPACLHGCPAVAYRKDPETGIVIHSDSDCIGCQYCTLTCPYEVPHFDRSLGIVRKCDMCQDRLAAGEPPACAQACPHDAIRITTVSTEEVRFASESGSLLPAAPDSKYTLPSTRYRSSKKWPANTLPVDYFAVRPERGHWSLAVMLVLTQMSVGAFALEYVRHWHVQSTPTDVHVTGHAVHWIASLLLGILGMSASIFHLGRPERAWKAWKGWRTSWLSREILGLALFAMLASLYVFANFLTAGLELRDIETIQRVLGVGAVASGGGAVFASVMIYVATHRPLWTFGRTAIDFTLTAALLSVALTLAVTATTSPVFPDYLSAPPHDSLRRLCLALLTLTGIRLFLEATRLWHLRDATMTPHRRAAMLLTGALSMSFVRRIFFGVLGGLILPALLLAEPFWAAGGYHPIFLAAASGLAWALVTTGEMLSRHLFFLTSVAPQMPGVQR